MEKTHIDLSTLFKVAPYSFTDGGYPVYRGKESDRVATFITEEEAKDYAAYRNRLLNERGTTVLN